MTSNNIQETTQDSIVPVNGHILVRLLKNDSFISSDSDTFQEKGNVISFSKDLDNTPLKEEMIVYFDSWLAAKFPSDIEGEYHWLVKWEDVRAVEI